MDWVKSKFCPLVVLVPVLFLTGEILSAPSARTSDDESSSGSGAIPISMLAFVHETGKLDDSSRAALAPDLALRTFEQRQHSQMAAPPSYSVAVVVHAVVPDTSQQGEFALKRRFIAPKTLEFTPVKFTGDSFVKSNVISRVLQSEVDHVSKGEGAATAIDDENYKFTYKGTELLEGSTAHVFQVKPRKKRMGLFKGRIFLNAATGDLQRAEGVLVKSPSFFIKKIGFVQDYTTVAGYTLPKHIYSIAGTRLVGKVVVEIATSDYELLPPTIENAGSKVVATDRKGSE
jgi:hypothetical protein